MKSKIVDALSEISIATKSIKNENDLKTLIKKYDMIFFGNQFNSVNSIELHHSLNKIFDINISFEELNALLPEICKELNIKVQELKSLNDDDSSSNCYIITL